LVLAALYVRPFYFIMQTPSPLAHSLIKIGTLLLCCFSFLLIPLKVSSLGYMPPDDAMRHTAFAVDHRTWSEVLLLNPEIRPEMDSHPGWHAMLRWLHETGGLAIEDLLVFSFCLTLVGFAAVGLAFSGSPVAWLLACGLAMLVEGGLFFRLLLGRPFAVSIMAFVALLFIWCREKPLKVWQELLISVVLLTVTIAVHPSVWYMWAAPWGILVLCRKWRSVGLLSVSVAISTGLAVAWVGSFYNVVSYPVIHLWHALGDDPLLGTSLVTEFQPSGGPVLVLIAVAGLLTIKHFRGFTIREEFRQVDFCLMLVMWVLGLKITRFWADWGVPAFVVWSCRQFIVLGFDQLRKPRETLVMVAGVAAALYLGITADVGGRYTQALKSPLLTKPVEDFQAKLPEKGGILYSTDMGVFYKLYYRLPHAGFRFTTGFEPGMLPPEDLKTLRAIQFNDGLLDAYKPWLDKMTEKDRVLLYYRGKPEWPGMVFEQFYTAWIGRKLTPAEEAEVKSEEGRVKGEGGKGRRR
jgi:hypothetical protein